MAEIIGGQKIITKDRLQTELHNFYTEILPYLSRNTTQTTLSSYNITSTSEVIASGTNSEIRSILSSWLEHQIIELSIRVTSNYTDSASRTVKGVTLSNMKLSENDRNAIKNLIDNTPQTDIEKLVIVKNSSNASAFNYAGLKFVEISISKASINEASITVGLDIESVPETSTFNFDVIASD